MVDLVHPAIFSFQIPDTPVFTGLFLNFSGMQHVYYNGNPSVCKVLYTKFPKQPNRELAGNQKIEYFLIDKNLFNKILITFYKFCFSFNLLFNVIACSSVKGISHGAVKTGLFAVNTICFKKVLFSNFINRIA